MCADFFKNVKDKAETVGQQLQAKLDADGVKQPGSGSPKTQRAAGGEGGAAGKPARPPPPTLGQVEPRARYLLVGLDCGCVRALVDSHTLVM